ncbi:MAG: single-stranded-DNA-specific exonuclease RecJ [Acidobacteria bacterium]|nr:MAG: single-stranded-DNA-specific exonuclease RecJ [Acidobacteriota bacterium]
MQLRWDVLTAPADRVHALAAELGISELTARLLVNRGLENPEEASAFLCTSLAGLHDPHLMKDMDRVLARIVRAIEQQEKILIYGDYDVDGITAIVVLRRALEMLGSRADFYLPRRLEEGYGLKAEVIKHAADQGYKLIISVDSGIRAFDAGEAAFAAGTDLIITDHHLPDQSLPPAFAILNPRRPDCPYPDKNLAGVGVVFKLVQALLSRSGKAHLLEHFLKLVAIGTIADVVPVVGENRIIARLGLEGLGDPRNVGLKALLEGAGVGKEVKLVDVGFKLAPRINAVTRMGGGREVIDLFSVRSPAEADAIVRTMNEMNSTRQKEEAGILSAIERKILEEPDLQNRYFLVFVGEGWHRGVIGIVASRIVERFHRPVLILSSDGRVCQGSGRSIPGFHLLDALDHCRDLLAQYGGHAQAAGCTLEADHFEALATRLNDYASRTLTPEDLCPRLQIECLLPIEQVTLPLIQEVELLAPFGTGNPLPVFASNQVAVAAGPWVLKEKHLKLQLKSNGTRLDAIWWKNGKAAETVKSGQPLDVAYTLSRETYQGRESVLLGVCDLRTPRSQDQSDL